MPVQIGAKTHHFSDPTELLSDCHRRIESFLGSLQQIAKVIDQPLTDEIRAALQSALRYFKEAAPKHTADEEESLFPRLRQIDSAEMKAAISTLESLEAEHRSADALHAEVHALGVRYLAEGTLPIEDARRFQTAVDNLAAIYGEHIRIEDQTVFPVAQRTLSASEKSAIASEMATRRNIVT